MANAILNFHFDYVTTSLTCFEKKHCSFSFRSVNCAIYTMVPWNSAFLAKKDTVFVFPRLALNNHFFAQSWQQMQNYNCLQAELHSAQRRITIVIAGSPRWSPPSINFFLPSLSLISSMSPQTLWTTPLSRSQQAISFSQLLEIPPSKNVNLTISSRYLGIPDCK